MYSALKHSHSGIRWLFLIFLVWAIYDAYAKWKSNTSYSKANRLPSFLGFIFAHLQATIGLLVYFVTPRITFGSGTVMKDSVMRFYAVEHPLGMLVAIILITMGYLKTKKSGSYKSVFGYYLAALLIVLLSIPWPFIEKYAASWF